MVGNNQFRTITESSWWCGRSHLLSVLSLLVKMYAIWSDSVILFATFDGIRQQREHCKRLPPPFSFVLGKYWPSSFDISFRRREKQCTWYFPAKPRMNWNWVSSWDPLRRTSTWTTEGSTGKGTHLGPSETRLRVELQWQLIRRLIDPYIYRW